MKAATCLLISFILSSIILFSSSADNLAPSQALRDDGSTIVSAGDSFVLGFFTKRSNRRYLGIWYRRSPDTVVWVANREVPLEDSSGTFRLTDRGVLVVLNGTNDTIWSSELPGTTRQIIPVAQLLDTGNLVVRDGEENVVWQSFDHIGDTFLPGVKFGRNLITGNDNYLTAWRSPDDPSLGEYTNTYEIGGYPQIILRRNSVIEFRSGPWNGERFSGMPNLRSNQIYRFEFVYNEEEVFYRYQLLDSSVISRMILRPNGVLERLIWTERTEEWNLYLTAQTDNCDRYSFCGPYGTCNINNSPPCGCLKGFVPRNPQAWATGDWRGGCVRRTVVECGTREGFQRIKSIKLPDTTRAWFNRTMDHRECERMCLRNCSCTAYGNLNVSRGGSGCLIWLDELVDIREYPDVNGDDIYIRLAASDIVNESSQRRRVKLIVIPVLSFCMVILGVCSIRYILKRKKLKRAVQTPMVEPNYYRKENMNLNLELPLFELDVIIDATNNFSHSNKIGEGGYGPVYKGILKDGQEIAVKRPSGKSKHGLDEFTNEVSSIAKLQHRNLVKLLGCCIQFGEKILIYEFLPNKSLDFFIFDPDRRKLPDWPKRCNIIDGIARGLLYLHQDSRLRIIHRDLKASNVLLDREMNPKISDFGMARSFKENEIAGNTKRVVGTYGYMSPEYQLDGQFSVKSDVFSFGVLVLEILSGTRNRGFSTPNHKHNLLGYAWILYKEGRAMELVDEVSANICTDQDQLLRPIHVGLLCVQQNPEDRPTMPTVVLMLTSGISMPQPKEPGFFIERELFGTDSSSSKGRSLFYEQYELDDVGKLTISELEDDRSNQWNQPISILPLNLETETLTPKLV